jgi:hypothetical protein
MTLFPILVFTGISAILGLMMRNRWRILLLLVVSTLAIFALQPALPVRNLDFWLPTTTLALTIIAWILTTPSEERHWREQYPAVAILVGLLCLLALTRYLGISLPLTASPPPQLWQVAFVLLIIVSLAAALARITGPNKPALTAFFLLIVVLFVVLKVPALAADVGILLRQVTQQSVLLASPLDLRWLGFSYLAFRILHTVRDRAPADCVFGGICRLRHFLPGSQRRANRPH